MDGHGGTHFQILRSYGVAVITLDFESSNDSNPVTTSAILLGIYLVSVSAIHDPVYTGDSARPAASLLYQSGRHCGCAGRGGGGGGWVQRGPGQQQGQVSGSRPGAGLS